MNSENERLRVLLQLAADTLDDVCSGSQLERDIRVTLSQQVEPCPICAEDEPHTGTCGSSDPRALCNRTQAEPAPAQNDLLDGITWQADPYEANVYRMLRGNNWVAHIRMNGEMLIERHAAMLNAMLAAQPAQPVPAQDEHLASAIHVGLELMGVIDEYRDMPCDSLRQRMFSTADRYRRRLSPVQTAPAQDEREAFEQHPLFRGMDFTRAATRPEFYASPYVGGAFDGWMAGRATRPAQTEQQPVVLQPDCDAVAVCGCRIVQSRKLGNVIVLCAAHTAARPAQTELVEALTYLLSWAERQVCPHDETERRGFIWEYCCGCNAKWADDEGGKPEFEWPKEIEKARAALTQHAKESE